MTVLYAESRDVDLFQLAKLLTDARSTEFTGDVSGLADLVRGSSRVAWATRDNHLIGFASALSDGVLVGFVTFIVVRDDCQGQGIERALVDRVVGDQPGVTFMLRGTATTAASCAALGFTATDAMCFTRKV